MVLLSRYARGLPVRPVDAKNKSEYRIPSKKLRSLLFIHIFVRNIKGLPCIYTEPNEVLKTHTKFYRR